MYKIPEINKHIFLFCPISIYNKPIYIETLVIEIDYEKDTFKTEKPIYYKGENKELNTCNEFSNESFEIVWFNDVHKLPKATEHYNKYFGKVIIDEIEIN